MANAKYPILFWSSHLFRNTCWLPKGEAFVKHNCLRGSQIFEDLSAQSKLDCGKLSTENKESISWFSLWSEGKACWWKLWFLRKETLGVPWKNHLILRACLLTFTRLLWSPFLAPRWYEKEIFVKGLLSSANSNYLWVCLKIKLFMARVHSEAVELRLCSVVTWILHPALSSLRLASSRPREQVTRCLFIILMSTVCFSDLHAVVFCALVQKKRIDFLSFQRGEWPSSTSSRATDRWRCGLAHQRTLQFLFIT